MKKVHIPRDPSNPARRGKQSSGIPSGDDRPADRVRRLRHLQAVGALLLVFSLVQYINTGAGGWPGTIIHKAGGALAEYTARPEAGWRQAAKSLEKLGYAKEAAPDFDLSGRVVRVADGDTVSILDANNKQHKVRLYGIDSPERDQPFGAAAKKALMQRVTGTPVDLVIVTTDSYGREVGTLYQQGVNINAAMVASGYAWWYQHFAPHERTLASLEQQARDQKLGLWAAPRPIPPWEWRRRRR